VEGAATGTFPKPRWLASTYVIAVALTGGIGSGKSAVSSLLSEKGAVVIDLDLVAREVVGRGTPGYAAVVERFGAGVLGEGGAIDRVALAAIVFSDPDERRELEQIVHPEVQRVAQSRLEEEASTDHVVVVDVPLLAESPAPRSYLQPYLQGILVVDAPIEIAVDRLVRLRGMSEEEARARISAQATREARVAIADFVILNDGTMTNLGAMTDKAWEWIERLAGAA
jgi:dephospho-CoA kinase